jgi:hypothetical protein
MIIFKAVFLECAETPLTDQHSITYHLSLLSLLPVLITANPTRKLMKNDIYVYLKLFNLKNLFLTVVISHLK